MSGLPFNQWVSKPTVYTSPESLREMEGKTVSYTVNNKKAVSRLAVEENTWGLALVRDDGVGVGYYRNPTWRPNRPQGENQQ